MSYGLANMGEGKCGEAAFYPGECKGTLRSASDLSPISLITNLLMVCVFIWDMPICGHWVMDIPLARRPKRHLRTSSIWLQPPFLNIHKRCSKLADHQSPYPPHPKLRVCGSKWDFPLPLRPHTSRWWPLSLCNINTTCISKLQDLGCVLNLANTHLENELPVFPSWIKPKNSIRIGNGG